ncbi:MAG: glycosyltransferase [Clostridia bacterium]|nr:glycosyltransferase [Clostridia bacterium]
MSNYKYKMSVIIPVYNCEKHLENCMNSLKRQTMKQSDFQIVFINDGSKDNSDAICLKLKEENSNVVYFKKENGGVSSARNKGLELAEGKYIMFLDADDSVSDNCLKSLYKFFEAHYDEVDLVTYNIDYLSETGKITSHKRFDILDHTAVYDINSDHNIMQTTMNICVKNVPENERILFDTNLTLGEDQLFIFSWISRKQKLGFVANATYTYYRHSGSASSIHNDPYYCFDQYIYFFNKLLSVCTTPDGKPHKTAQSMVVYNINWRITSDMLVSHADPELEAKQLATVKEVLKKVENSVIFNSIYVDPFHMECFIRLKDLDYDYAVNNTSLSVYTNNHELWFSQPHSIVFDTIKIADNKLKILGFVKTCILPLNNLSFYYIDTDNELHEVELTETLFSCYKGKAKTNNFGGFDISIPLSDYNSIGFRLKIDNVIITPVPFYSFRCVVNNVKTFVACGDYTVELNKKSKGLLIRKANAAKIKLAAQKADLTTLRENRNAFIYRKTAKLTKGTGDIWLYCDRENIFDNAYEQFRHDFDINDGVRRYYIVDNLKDSDKTKYFTPKQRKHLVKFKSIRHRLLFLNSSKVFTSFNSISIISPFGNLPLRWYSDMIQTEIIYLQHGVLHANLPNLYVKEKANVDKIVISSEFEKKNFTEIYRFKDEDLLFSGMPRFDSIDVSKPPKRKILFSPSWRKNLIGEYVDNTRMLYPEKFLASPFYTQVNAFLNSPELAELLEKYDLTLDFKNHPIFSCYDEYFEVSNPRINITQENINMQDYLAMITDYSSVVFDFVYLSRPIIYFVPDYDQFRAGLTHGYSKLDLPLEEGFGDITQTGEELLKAVKTLAENDFRASEVYQKRMDDFFGARDTDHCERLYNLCK